MPYFSQFYQIEVRDEIAKEWTNRQGNVDDMMAGLHEIRARLIEEHPTLKAIEGRAKARQGKLDLGKASP